MEPYINNQPGPVQHMCSIIILLAQSLRDECFCAAYKARDFLAHCFLNEQNKNVVGPQELYTIMIVFPHTIASYGYPSESLGTRLYTRPQELYNSEHNMDMSSTRRDCYSIQCHVTILCSKLQLYFSNDIAVGQKINIHTDKISNRLTDQSGARSGSLQYQLHRSNQRFKHHTHSHGLRLQNQGDFP